jgi:hypothetical protein
MPNPIVNYLHDEEEVGIQGMATAELWLLGVLCSKLISNAVEQLDVTLLWVLL